eukprot:m.39683 g.39683  ORF g.39683 m.39683 type:complete len:191 (-) comp5572_c0_seq2:215-787(-)
MRPWAMRKPAKNMTKSWTMLKMGPMGDFDDMLSQMRNRQEEMRSSLPCEACGRSHKRIPTSRTYEDGRYCAQHREHHAIRAGDIWAETNKFGLSWILYAYLDGKVWDVTEWGRCQSLDRLVSPNLHGIIIRASDREMRNAYNEFSRDVNILEELLRAYAERERTGRMPQAWQDEYQEDQRRNRRRNRHRK